MNCTCQVGTPTNPLPHPSPDIIPPLRLEMRGLSAKTMVCLDCGATGQAWLVVTSELWQKIGSPPGELCANCMATRILGLPDVIAVHMEPITRTGKT